MREFCFIPTGIIKGAKCFKSAMMKVADILRPAASNANFVCLVISVLLFRRVCAAICEREE